MDYKKLGERLREIRLKANLTQEKLGEKIGLSSEYISQLERADRVISIDILERYVQYFEVSLEELLRGSIASNKNDKIRQLMETVKDCSEKELLLIIDTTKTILSHIK